MGKLRKPQLLKVTEEEIEHTNIKLRDSVKESLLTKKSPG